MNSVVKSTSLIRRYSMSLLLMLAPWVLTLMVRDLGPIQFLRLNQEYIVFLLFYLIISFVSFTFFFFIKKRITHNGNQTVYKGVYKLMVALAILYAGVTLFDFFIVKHGSVSQIVAMREKENVVGPRNSLIGALGFLLSGAPPVAFALLLSNEELSKKRKRFLKALCIVGILSMFLSGGRNAFFISSFFIYFYYTFFQPSSGKKRTKEMVLLKYFLYLALIACFVYSMKIFLDRFMVLGLAQGKILDHLANDYKVEIYRLPIKNDFIQSVYIAVVYLIFYSTHAFAYMSQYFEANYSPFFMGAYNFPQISRFFEIIFGSFTTGNVSDRMILPGVYLTLPGSIFLDAGYVGTLIFAGLFGGLYGYLSRNIERLGLYQKILYSYICVVLIFGPIYSVFGMGNGLSIIFMTFVAMVFSIRPFWHSGEKGLSQSHVIGN